MIVKGRKPCVSSVQGKYANLSIGAFRSKFGVLLGSGKIGGVHEAWCYIVVSKSVLRRVAKLGRKLCG